MNAIRAYTYTITIDPSAGLAGEVVLAPYCKTNEFEKVCRLNSTGVTSLGGEQNVPIVMRKNDTLTFAIKFNFQGLNIDPSTDNYISKVYLNSLIAAMYTNPGSNLVNEASVGQSKDLGSVFAGPIPLGTSMAIYVAPNVSGSQRVEGLELSLTGTTIVPTEMTVITLETLLYEMSAKGELLLVTENNLGEGIKTEYYSLSFLIDPVVSITPL